MMGAVTSVYRRHPDGATDDGRGRTVPRHLNGESILSHGGMRLLEMAGVLSHPGSEGHDGC